jgi:AcrR family transcriptional regulator
MARDAQATRGRLLRAATTEFAAYGIAGARVDRIAAAAGSNKAQIYHYFASKEGLFDEVLRTLIADRTRDIPIETGDLADYGARLFESYEDHPEVVRLATWHRLEHANSGNLLGSVVASLEEKVDAIARAQERGELSRRFEAGTLLGLVLHLASIWTVTTPEFAALLGTSSRAMRRQVVIDSIRTILGDDASDELASIAMDSAAGPALDPA